MSNRHARDRRSPTMVVRHQEARRHRRQDTDLVTHLTQVRPCRRFDLADDLEWELSHPMNNRRCGPWCTGTEAGPFVASELPFVFEERAILQGPLGPVSQCEHWSGRNGGVEHLACADAQDEMGSLHASLMAHQNVVGMGLIAGAQAGFDKPAAPSVTGSRVTLRIGYGALFLSAAGA
jgi:hypothetical protein